MNSFIYWCCSKLMWLNKLPRYGRLYRVTFTDDEMITGPARWVWQRHGYWGMNLLGDYFDVYFDEYERRNPGKEPDANGQASGTT